MKYLSTFTGVGGMDMGFDAVGMECIGMVEIDKNARAVLNHHWPEVPKHDDITTAISSGWADDIVRLSGRPDVLIGGAPCQDLSAAGKRAGYSGERSSLFFDQLRLATHVGARWLVYENVPGLLTSNGGWDFREALHQMAEAGFVHIEWRELDSQFFGVPQRRKRIFVVACSDPRIDGGREVLTEPEGMSWDPAPFLPPRPDTARSVEAGAGEGGGRVLADTGVVQALTQGLGSGGPDAQHAQAGWLVPEVDGMYWDGGQTSDCLDVSMLVKGQMLPEKRRMPAVLVREDT